MCCFSGTIEHVGDTRIFVRTHFDGTEFLAYQMTYESEDDLAMILPIPTIKNPREDAVKFINLEKYPAFFDSLESGFPRRARGGGGGLGGFGGVAAGDVPPVLEVVDVGEFEASFVPTVNDFSRLDERYRLPETIWTQTLPRYRDWGFVVFKLKSGNLRPHPMAFSFPRREPAKSFFPTLHIHDGTVPKTAPFDHVLYGQFFGGNRANYLNWRESPQTAQQFMKIDQAQGLLDETGHVYRLSVVGEKKNRDYII